MGWTCPLLWITLECGGLPVCNQKGRKFLKPLPLMTGWCHLTNSLSVEGEKKRKLPIPRFVLGLVESVIQSDPSGSAFLCAYRNPSKQPSVPIYTFFLDVHLYKSKRRERIPPQLRHIWEIVFGTVVRRVSVFCFDRIGIGKGATGFLWWWGIHWWAGRPLLFFLGAFSSQRNNVNTVDTDWFHDGRGVQVEPVVDDVIFDFNQLVSHLEAAVFIGNTILKR